MSKYDLSTSARSNGDGTSAIHLTVKYSNGSRNVRQFGGKDTQGITTLSLKDITLPAEGAVL